MKNIIAALSIILLFISCEQTSKKNNNTTQYIPEEAEIIIKTTNLQELLASLNSNELFKKNQFLINQQSLDEMSLISEHFKGENSTIAFSGRKNGLANFIFSVENFSSPYSLDSLNISAVESIKFKSVEIKKYVLEDIELFASVSNKNLLVSNSQEQLKSVLSKDSNNKNLDISLRRAIAASDKKKNSVFIKHKSFDEFLNNTFGNISLPLMQFGDWSVLDLDISPGSILFNGITTSSEDQLPLSHLFNNINPKKNLLAKVTPINSAGFYSITYNHFEKLYKNLQKHQADSLALNDNHLFHYTKEAGVVYLNKDKVLVLTTTDPELAKHTLSDKEISNFRGHAIYQNTSLPEISRYLEPLIQSTDNAYYSFIDQFLIFAGNTDTLQNIITSYQNGDTLDEQSFYKDAVSNLAENSSLLFVLNSDVFEEELPDFVANNYQKDAKSLNLKNYPIAALQFVADRNFMHLHGIVHSGTSSKSKKAKQLSSIKLSALPVTKPSLIKNHDTNKKELIFQDDQNQLHLYTLGGKLLWSKKLDSRIIGEIQQVDLYKNGNLQFALNTLSELHIIDRNGKTVEPFPLKFKDAITQPLSIFDYENNKNYRFVVTQNNEVLMYNSKGKEVKGFDFGKTKTEILQAPKHIRIANKDYIVIPEASKKLHILSRQGKSRIKVKGEIEFSENEWYEHNNQFVSLSNNQELLKIDQSGAIKTTKLKSEVNTQIDATEEILATLSENILKINNKEITLDYGLYTAPKIFKVKGNTFIAITDTQASKVYIFNKDGKLLPDLPVYGNSAIDLDLDVTGKNLLFTTLGEDSTILVYQLGI